MSTFIDRRLNPRDKTIKNRQKFIQRSKEQIKKAVREVINTGNISDIENGKTKIKVKGIDEPSFTIDSKTGDKKYVLPGNDKYIVGDKEKKPEDGEGQGGTQGGLGRSEDDFEFLLNQDEFLNFIFDDLELPNLIKKQMKDVTKVKPHRAGYTNVGNPSQLDIIRSLKNSLGRRIGLKRPKKEEIEELEKSLESITDEKEKQDILNKIEEMKRRQKVVPWLDPFDVRYRNFVPQPQPMTKAVMFCIMDVSASMGKEEKYLAKRFFFFLYMFLRRKYTKVDIIFVRHHEEAAEVDEENFFHSKESGGTVVSSAVKLTKDIIEQRYNVNDWNIYVAQASDGDNYNTDTPVCYNAMRELLPIVQYYAYVEIQLSPYQRVRYSELWKMFDELRPDFPQLHTRSAHEVKDIWKVFKELFSKEKVK